MSSTTLTNWFIVKLIDNNVFLGYFLWGIVQEDKSLRFQFGDYVCTSKIRLITPAHRKVTTISDNTYILVNKGKSFTANIEDLEKLRAGISPDEIRTINMLIDLEF